MKTISYYNRKGGVGKTTVSFLFSRFLISAGKKVLILDLDPQKSLTSHFTRLHKIDRKRLKEQNAFTVLLGKDDINEAIIQIDSEKFSNCYILPGSFDLSDIQGNISILSVKNALKQLKIKFDYCIIDLSPNFSTLIQAALVSSDLIIIPSLPAIEDMEQADWTYKKIETVCGADRKILLNQFKHDKPGKLEKEVMDFYIPSFNGHCLKHSIPPSGLIRRYTQTGESITSSAKAKVSFMESFAAFVKEATKENLKVTSF
ncbi:MAG: AAA family ATPase [Leptospiraceae bacterium]|jgi:cellulose biosynthesis protein BcsQ|nr:AAA family ATPase [Leptospiraceae bacterium]MBP9887889.1 AAA family ATPase [Leptospiraceae bacterium]